MKGATTVLQYGTVVPSHFNWKTATLLWQSSFWPPKKMSTLVQRFLSPHPTSLNPPFLQKNLFSQPKRQIDEWSTVLRIRTKTEMYGSQVKRMHFSPPAQCIYISNMERSNCLHGNRRKCSPYTNTAINAILKTPKNLMYPEPRAVSETNIFMEICFKKGFI